MKHISAGDVNRKSEFASRLSEAYAELQATVENFNAEVEQKFDGEVQPVIDRYNDIVSEANAWREDIYEDIYNEIQEYYNSRSENWQNGDKGTEYLQWVDEWMNEIETIDVDTPNSIEINGDDVGADLEDNYRDGVDY